MTAMNAKSIVSLSPRDGLFLKDGRGWFTSESGRAGSLGWPFASTVRGALRTCLGHAHEETVGRPLAADEWLHLNAGLGVDAVLPLCRPVGTPFSAAARRWPAPRDGVVFTGEERVRPLTPTARSTASTIVLDGAGEATAIEGLRHPSPGEVSGKPDAMPSWWCDAAFTAWLCGLPVKASEIAPTDRPVSRVQTHVTIDPVSGAAHDGGLFSSTVIEPLTRTADEGGAHEWAVAAIGSGFEPGNLAGRRVRLGGDGRFATCEPMPPTAYAMPDPLRHAFAAGPRGLRMVLVSHASFTRGWLPEWLELRQETLGGVMPGVGDVILRAACVGRPVSVSGWDMAARRPKPTRRLVPAGSVYFFEKADGAAFTAADAEAIWLWGIGEAAAQGEATGAVVPGIWKPA
jgi:CRISPR-associated protein Cmr3